MTIESVDHSEYTVVPATLDQLEQHSKIAFIHWHHNKPFAVSVDLLEQPNRINHTDGKKFLDGTLKEHRECEWGRDGRHEVWVLVRREDLLGEIYAGCEVYQRNALIRPKGYTEVEGAWMYAIASVVTSPNHLRKGLATHLLKLLHYILADPTYLPPFPSQWGTPPPILGNPDEMKRRNLGNAIASILFSDVGYKFYEKCTIGLTRPGWKVRLEENTELLWDISSSNTVTPVNSMSWEWITEGQLPAVRNDITKLVKRDLREIKGANTIWQCDPSSPGLLTWLANRGPWLGSVQPSSPPHLGLQMQNDDGTRTIVLFTAYNEHVGRRLLVTHTTNLKPEHIPSLLVMLDQAAKEAGRNEGWIWGLREDDPLVRAWKQVPGRNVRVGSRKEIDGHLLGVAWYGPEEDQGELVDRQIWHWC